MKILIVLLALLAYIFCFGIVSDYYNNANWVNAAGVFIGGFLVVYLTYLVNKYVKQ